MSSILVPIDFSENATVALKFALLIAKELKYKVQILHVMDMPNFERFLSEDVVKNLTKDNIINRFKTLIEEKILTEAKDVSTVEIEYIIKNGNVTQEIIDTTKVLNPDLVVIGQKGNGARIWEGFWIGGTTQRIIKKVRQPLIIVPVSARFRTLKHIAFATDFNIDDYEVIENLLKMAKNASAKVSAVHVVAPKEKVNKKALQNLQNNFSEYIDSKVFSVELVESDSVSEGLNTYAKNQKVSLLAVLQEKTNLLDRVMNGGDSIAISMNAEIPTLIFKEK
jgi:nucleotide-binding universal stress UspA family protein